MSFGNQGVQNANLPNLISSGNGFQIAANSPLNPTASGYAGILMNALTLLVGVQPTYRVIDAELEISSATTSVSGSVVGVRGNVTQDASGTLGSGSFVYGVQGKWTAKGTLSTGSGFTAGLFGQLDFSAVTAVNASYVSALHLDMGATSALSSSAYINAQTVTNTTQCLMNAVLKVIANASYFMDLAESNLTGHWIVGLTAGANAAKSLKILVGGSTYYIPLSSSAT